MPRPAPRRDSRTSHRREGSLPVTPERRHDLRTDRRGPQRSRGHGENANAQRSPKTPQSVELIPIGQPAARARESPLLALRAECHPLAREETAMLTHERFRELLLDYLYDLLDEPDAQALRGH